MALKIRLGGKSGIRNIPVYPITNWRRVRSDENVVLYKPSLRTFAQRLLWTLVMGIIVAALSYSFLRTDPADEHAAAGAQQSQQLEEAHKRTAILESELKYMLTEEQWREIEEERVRRETRSQEARGRLHRFDGIANAGLITVLALLAFVGAIMPLSCLWSFLVVRLNPRGELEVRHWGLLRLTTRRWACPSLERIDITLQEIYHRGGLHTRAHHGGWQWKIAIMGRPEAHARSTHTLCEFWIDLEKDRPMDDRISARTREFIDTVQRLTGLTHGDPMVMEYGIAAHRSVGRRSHRAPVGKSTVRPKAYHSIEDMPEELREQFAAPEEQSRQHGGIPMQSVRRKITIRDNAGKDHTYDSLEEMPPKVRAYYERTKNRPPRQ